MDKRLQIQRQIRGYHLTGIGTPDMIKCVAIFDKIFSNIRYDDYAFYLFNKKVVTVDTQQHLLWCLHSDILAPIADTKLEWFEKVEILIFYFSKTNRIYENFSIGGTNMLK